jgi:type I restriction-modification system DNA methylase subunit
MVDPRTPQHRRCKTTKDQHVETLLDLKPDHVITVASTAQVELNAALKEMREALHRRGRMSSRNEALDELAKLLFAHTVSVQAGGYGIGKQLTRDGNAALALIEFVNRMVAEHLPTSLGYEFSVDDFALKLRSTEDQLAAELIAAFEAFTTGSAQLGGSRFGSDLINDAFGQFIVDSFADEKELGQYLTPSEVVRFMVNLAIDEMTPEERESLSTAEGFEEFGLVMDPSCGVGSFLAEFIRAMHAERAAAGVVGADWVQSACRDLVVGLDKSERMVRLALANLATFGATAARLHLGNSLAKSGDDARTPSSFDGKVGLILTNPPFGATFRREELAGYKIANEWGGNPSTVDSELLFMERYLEWLRPGGQLIAVVPDSILTNGRLFADLRAGLAPQIEIRSVISLPAVTFAAAGTSTKTSIVHLRKGKRPGSEVRFAICNDVGYAVTKRRKVHTSDGDLPGIRQALLSSDQNVVTVLPDLDEAGRWDAGFHGSPSGRALAVAEALESTVRVRDVARLSNDRVNPRKFRSDTFEYIEIADVDGERLSVGSKLVQAHDAPSRARMLVRAGDVLVSTVRPERGAIGVVPAHLDNAVCSTGFGVLRSTGIHPILLATLLRSDFVRDQFLRHNVGIAYPAIDPLLLPDIVLPVGRDNLLGLADQARAYAEADEAARVALIELNGAVGGAIMSWSTTIA